jgi:hypothetical protein
MHNLNLFFTSANPELERDELNFILSNKQALK